MDVYYSSSSMISSDFDIITWLLEKLLSCLLKVLDLDPQQLWPNMAHYITTWASFFFSWLKVTAFVIHDTVRKMWVVVFCVCDCVSKQLSKKCALEKHLKSQRNATLFVSVLLAIYSCPWNTFSHSNLINYCGTSVDFNRTSVAVNPTDKEACDMWNKSVNPPAFHV